MKTLFSAVFLLSLVWAVPGYAGEKEAKAYVGSVSDKVLAIISNEKLGQNEKQKKLIALFEQTVDTKWIGRFVLGRYYNTATPTQKKEYDAVYREFLIRSYVPRFREYKGEKIQLADARKDGKDEFLVKTNIVAENEPAIRVDYRVRESGGVFRVVDIISEGVSLINTQRSEFGSVVSREGMDYLVDQLEQRLEQLKAEK